jgi:hypothetical protein
MTKGQEDDWEEVCTGEESVLYELVVRGPVLKLLITKPGDVPRVAWKGTLADLFVITRKDIRRGT